MRVAKVILVGVMVVPIAGSHPQASDAPLFATEQTQLSSPSLKQNALSSIISLGFLNKLPMGVIIEGDSLCAHQLDLPASPFAAKELISRIENQVPGYTAATLNGVLYVHPRSITSNSDNVLNLTLPTFTSPQGSFQQGSVALWMNIRAHLVPKEGTAFVGGSTRSPERLQSFSVSNSSVEQILDILVARGQGGLWMMRQVSSDWQANPQKIPYEVVGYSDGHEHLEVSDCSGISAVDNPVTTTR
jgi:hypothetical protein